MGERNGRSVKERRPVSRSRCRISSICPLEQLTRAIPGFRVLRIDGLFPGDHRGLGIDRLQAGVIRILGGVFAAVAVTCDISGGLLGAGRATLGIDRLSHWGR